MRIKYNLLILLFVSLSCSSDDTVDSNVSNCQITAANPLQLFYEYMDELELGSTTTGPFTSFDGIHFEYDSSNRINKVFGGPVMVPVGGNLIEWVMSNSVEYDILYSENTISIMSNYEPLYEGNLRLFNITNSNLINRTVTIPQGLLTQEVTFNYTYEGNTILEYKGDELYRTFYLENGNLVKVEELRYGNLTDPLGEPNTLIGKNELVFSEFDNLPNLLKAKFYIDGAFFKGFSNNNYHAIELKRFNYDQSSQEFILDENFHRFRSYTVPLNSDGSSGLFTSDCL